MNQTAASENLLSVDNGVDSWRAWKVFFTPIIILTGMFGNSLSFLVFVFSNLRKSPISVFLSGLAVSDTGFLATVGAAWLAGVTDSSLFDTDFKCQTLVFCSFVFSFLSVWYVVAFTSVTYCSVFYPYLSSTVFNRKTALVVVFGLFGLAVCPYALCFTSIVSVSFKGKHSCTSSNEKIARSMSIADTVLTLIIPFSLLIVMNARIFVDMVKFYGPVKPASKNDDSTDAPSATTGDSAFISSSLVNDDSFSVFDEKPVAKRQRTGQATGRNAQRKTRKMLMVVALVFLLLNLPSHLIRAQHTIRSVFQVGYQPSASEMYWLDVFSVIHWINYSINFVLYSACAKSFRQVPYDVFWKCLAKINQACRLANGLVRRRNERRAKQEVAMMVSVPGADKVNCHLSAMRFSNLQSLESSYVFKSPPCLLTENTIH